MQHNRNRQSGYGRDENEQSQRNYNTGEDQWEEQQHPDPQQDNINQQPAPQAPQEIQSSGSYRVFQPDPAKREKLLALARKEEEEYERFKESRRPGPIHLTPRKLGGQTPESDAREQQQVIQAQSKYQKMMQREEYRKKIKEEEEAEIQKKKDIQRKKAEKLEEKRQQQDKERMQSLHEDRCIRNNAFLDHLQPTHHPYNNRFGQTSNLAVKQEQDDDWMLQQALKDSLLTHKTEEKTRVQEMKQSKHKQPMQQTYKQQQKEEEERRLKEMKEQQRKKAEVLKQHEAERTWSEEEQRRRVNNAFLDRLERPEKDQRPNTSQHGYTGESNTWA